MEKVFLYGGEDINQVGFRVMYVLYKYDGLENVKRHYQFKKNKNKYGDYSSITLYKSKEEQLNRVFFTNGIDEYKFDSLFIFDGQEYFCSMTWYCEENQTNNLKSFPRIEKLKSLLEISYKDTFRLEKESGKWVFYGTSECKKYIDEVDLERSVPVEKSTETGDIIKTLKSNIEKANASLIEMQEQIKIMQDNLKHIVGTTPVVKSHADVRKSKTKAIKVTESKNLYVNTNEGLVGYGLKNGEYVCNCSVFDDIIVIHENGKYKVSKVTEKTFYGEGIIYVAVWHKNDYNTIYDVVYRDGRTPISHIKRFAITNVIRDKEYDMTKGTPWSKLLYFKANSNGEADVISCKLKPRPKLRKLTFEVDFKDIAIKSRDAQGNIFTRTEIHKITQKEGI